MDNKEKSPEQELIESISLMIEKAMGQSTTMYTGVLKSINGKKAVVTINGQDQTVSVISPSALLGAITRVFVPNGNMSNAFIIGGEGGGSSGSGTQIATGTYSGNGAYGANNAISLTFGFTPKFVYLYSYISGAVSIEGVLINPCHSYMVTISNSYPVGSSSNVVTWSNNGVSWYSTSNANRQFNMNGATVYYFAIGS